MDTWVSSLTLDFVNDLALETYRQVFYMDFFLSPDLIIKAGASESL